MAKLTDTLLSLAVGGSVMVPNKTPQGLGGAWARARSKGYVLSAKPVEGGVLVTRLEVRPPSKLARMRALAPGGSVTFENTTVANVRHLAYPTILKKGVKLLFTQHGQHVLVKRKPERRRRED